MVVDGGRHVGKNCQYHGISPQLLSQTPIVYIDVRKLRWCSVDSAAFHASAWPTFDAKKAKSIARTLWTNRCQLADVLVVRGCCWCSSRSCFDSNRVFEDLLWHWNDMRRPWVVYKEGSESTGGGDPGPDWMNDGYCVSNYFCQCNFVGVGASGLPRSTNGQGCHHPGKLYSKQMAIRQGFGQTLNCNCRYSRVKTHYPYPSCNGHTMNVHVATNLTRSVISMLIGAPPRVPRRLGRHVASGEALLSNEVRIERGEARNRLENARCDVERFLERCEARRSQQRLPPNRISWRNRPRWNGSITNLTPVVGGSPGT